jgi:hypothetical protein
LAEDIDHAVPIAMRSEVLTCHGFSNICRSINSIDLVLPAVFLGDRFSTTENHDRLQFGTGGFQSDFNKRLFAAHCRSERDYGQLRYRIRFLATDHTFTKK